MGAERKGKRHVAKSAVIDNRFADEFLMKPATEDEPTLPPPDDEPGCIFERNEEEP